MEIHSNKLPIISTFKQAISNCYSQFNILIKYATPLIIIQAILILSGNDNLISVFKEDSMIDNITGMDVLGFIIYILILIMTIISCHRIFLLNNESIKNTKVLRWEYRELRYVGWALVIGIIMFLIQFVLGIIIAVLGVTILENHLITMGIIIFLIGSYFSSRLSLLFPATAVDNEENNVEYVWRISKDNSLRLMLLITILPTIVNILISYLPVSNNKIYLLSTSIIWLVVGVVEVCLLSLSYSFLSKQNEVEEQTLI